MHLANILYCRYALKVITGLCIRHGCLKIQEIHSKTIEKSRPTVTPGFFITKIFFSEI